MSHFIYMTRPHFIPGQTVVFPVKNRSGKKEVAAYLAARLGVDDAWAAVLVRDGHVKVDGRTAAAGDVVNLSAGPHTLEAYIPHDWPKHMAATEMPLDILHEDERLAVLNKPAGIVVHPARGHLDCQTLQNGMRHRYRHLLALPETTIGSPHRLDKDTSGAIVFALDRVTYASLVAQFSNGEPHKEYLAVVDGRPDFDELSCRSPLGADPERKGLGTVVPCEAGGKTARTDFTVVERGDGWALVRAVPFTGRPHQIRIHAASLGLPLAGDGDYNRLPDRAAFPRQALHAAALTFTHPGTGERLRVEAPLPDDFRLALERLRHGGC
jgi:23S rRNA pseudouridine1911/1915/1917 synthase